MYSTTKNIATAPPVTTGRIAGKLLKLPPNPERLQECGLRLDGKYKASNDELPLVSVITAVMNRTDTIEKCLQSVLDQTYTNIEYIVIDGGSTDGTFEIIGKYCDSIDYAVSEPDTGIYNAFNKGISLATGDYIIFLNSDDWYTSDAITALVTHAVTSNAEVTHANACTILDDGKVWDVLNGWLHDGLYTRGMPVRHETMLTKKEIYEKYGYYDENFPILADYAYLITLYSDNCTIAHVDKVLLYFRMSGVSYQDKQERTRERERLYGNLFPFLEKADLQRLAENPNMPPMLRAHFMGKYFVQDGARTFVRSMFYNFRKDIIDVTRLLRKFRFLRKFLRSRRISKALK
jgi:glycosyltransferase involved in cell wall biosynthesis